MECTYITDKDLAQMLGLSVKYVQKLVREGKGPTRYQFGRSVKFRRTDVESWIERHRIEATDE